jgi:NAD(P)-dependent dehydrogenase (short-subunit alcohol dehydrogenase family)
MQARLAGRRIVITGVSRGIGLETARLFLAEGANVLGVARDGERLGRAEQELANGTPGSLAVIAEDLPSAGSEERVARVVEERWGALDVLFNNAAVMAETGEARGPIAEPPGTLERTLSVNLLAPFRLTRALVPALTRGKEPRVVLVSSGAGAFAAMREPRIGSYRLSKWALNGLTLLLATELAGTVSVNAFDPGWVKTDLGGPNAPGLPEDSARGALALVTLPFSTTGKFWKDGREVPF